MRFAPFRHAVFASAGAVLVDPGAWRTLQNPLRHVRGQKSSPTRTIFSMLVPPGCPIGSPQVIA